MTALFEGLPPRIEEASPACERQACSCEVQQLCRRLGAQWTWHYRIYIACCVNRDFVDQTFVDKLAFSLSIARTYRVKATELGICKYNQISIYLYIKIFQTNSSEQIPTLPAAQVASRRLCRPCGACAYMIAGVLCRRADA